MQIFFYEGYSLALSFNKGVMTWVWSSQNQYELRDRVIWCIWFDYRFQPPSFQVQALPDYSFQPGLNSKLKLNSFDIEMNISCYNTMPTNIILETLHVTWPLMSWPQANPGRKRSQFPTTTRRSNNVVKN